MPDVSRGKDHPDGRNAHDGWISYLVRASVFAWSLLVGSEPVGGAEAEVVRPLPPEEADQMGMSPYSRADAEALRVLSRVACHEPHEGTGAHVEYWIQRGWCALIWRRQCDTDPGRMSLRITQAGRRELQVWHNRKARA